MDLYIRSQDKKTLIKSELLNIEPSSNGWCINEYRYDLCLGHYETEKRALELLDEIQNCLLANFNFNGSYEEVDLKIKAKTINGLYGFIYKMPKE